MADTIFFCRGKVTPDHKTLNLSDKRITILRFCVRIICLAGKEHITQFLLVNCRTLAGNAKCPQRDSQMTQVRNILITDDDDELRTALAEQLALHEEFSTN